MTVCRGCCCGTVKKYPDYDHDDQLARLRALADRSGGTVTVRTADCLDVCESSNVIVVKRPGEKPVWFGLVLHDAVLSDLEDWLETGGPLPELLELNLIRGRLGSAS
ncbi:(2Fe-2S) ferredoxin domain-containing protein [Saccharothrix violaceirubra]|uniref:(2Fe-2S) ferredoxin n=1 Tax=Saccharothrix violaceirubra TaxID=413306 RepID=A0A7W7T7R8_9PSEU|nr:(2Fe-2S) ferredoxin domain-containing protein [Saccharothrix violaceirubra]MBB4967871.1 (2Fe-2S) ferredoxin [Saccharothrix violaceirubra]